MKKYYKLTKILQLNAVYNFIIGERSNGKTFACLEYAVKEFIKNGNRFAYIRRRRDEMKAQDIQKLCNKPIKEWTKGEYSIMNYYQNDFWLCNVDDKGIVHREALVGHRFNVQDELNYKSYEYPNVQTIIYDEVITSGSYLEDEFVEFENLLSTIIRDRLGVKIFMLGNTISKYCPYFQEMGLTNVKKQKQGTIDFYTYGESLTTVALEYCRKRDDNESKLSKSTYFGFNNPKLKMITQGYWQIAIYPKLPIKYVPKNIVMNFFICFDGETLKADIVNVDKTLFIFIMPFTREMTKRDTSIIYQQEFSVNPLHHRNILTGTQPYAKLIQNLFKDDKVFYQSNEVGDLVNAYLEWCYNL